MATPDIDALDLESSHSGDALSDVMGSLTTTPVTVALDLESSHSGYSLSDVIMTTSVTVALDLGSSHSGYALCDVTGSLVESRFVQGGKELTRVPSCLLLQPVLSLHSFGWEAWMQLQQLEDDEGFHYFQGFPCLGPHTQGDGTPLMLRDHKGRELPAKYILSIFIGCLKDHVISTLGPDFEANDVTWVMTLPASCDVTVTDTLMDAALQAGLPEHHLKQVSGMEAAALHASLSSLDLGPEQPLTLMLVDCGGGAVTASVFELSGDSPITEKGDPLSRPGGGDWVDEDFKVFLTDLIGVHDLGDPESADVARAIRAFVEVKHSAVDSEKVALTLAPSLSARVKRGQGQVSLVKNKLLMTRDLYRSFFSRAVDAVTATIQQALQDCEVDAILLFGGFGQCPVVKDAVEEKFPQLQLRVLPSPETVVARGAVAKYCQLLDVISDAAAAGGEPTVQASPETVVTKSDQLPDVTSEAAAVEGEEGPDSGTKLLVVAIDFGTTYSGYCYSFVSDLQDNPLRVMGQHFVTEDGQQVDKVPTSVLFTPDKEFHSFGHEAEKTFAKMYDEDKEEAKKWFFFEKFKMTLLREKDLSEDTKLPDESKKKWMPALGVFAAAIGYLKGHVMDTLAARKAGVKLAEIQWVLTVPAIWDDRARQFMHRAAEKAGIPGDNLLLALEPEAASVYCLKYFQSNPLTLTRPSSPSSPVSPSQPGTRFLLVDNGGGTIDIAVCEVTEGGNLRLLHRAAGTDKGGKMVDEALKEFLYNLVGFDGVSSFERLEMLHLFQQFELSKRLYDGEAAIVRIQVPPSMVIALEEALSQTKKDTFKDVKLNSKNILVLPKTVFESFFQKSIESITSTVKAVLEDEQVGSVDAILLAGGFSESRLVQDAIKEAFPRDLVLVAPSPSAAVLMGAVIFGHASDVIATRVSAFTYGVSAGRPFQEDDDESKAVDVGGQKYVKDAFVVYIRKDQELDADSLLPYRSYRPASNRQRQARIEIFRSSSKAPRYVDEAGCERIGTVTVELPDMGDGEGAAPRQVQAAMRVGGTELCFIARDEASMREFTVQCEFLAKV